MKGTLAADPYPDNKLRKLLDVLPVPPLPAPLRRLIEWTADYYSPRWHRWRAWRFRAARHYAGEARSPNTG